MACLNVSTTLAHSDELTDRLAQAERRQNTQLLEQDLHDLEEALWGRFFVDAVPERLVESLIEILRSPVPARLTSRAAVCLAVIISPGPQQPPLIDPRQWRLIPKARELLLGAAPLLITASQSTLAHQTSLYLKPPPFLRKFIKQLTEEKQLGDSFIASLSQELLDAPSVTHDYRYPWMAGQLRLEILSNLPDQSEIQDYMLFNDQQNADTFWSVALVSVFKWKDAETLRHLVRGLAIVDDFREHLRGLSGKNPQADLLQDALLDQLQAARFSLYSVVPELLRLPLSAFDHETGLFFRIMESTYLTNSRAQNELIRMLAAKAQAEPLTEKDIQFMGSGIETLGAAYEQMTLDLGPPRTQLLGEILSLPSIQLLGRERAPRLFASYFPPGFLSPQERFFNLTQLEQVLTLVESGNSPNPELLITAALSGTPVEFTLDPELRRRLSPRILRLIRFRLNRSWPQSTAMERIRAQQALHALELWPAALDSPDSPVRLLIQLIQAPEQPALGRLKNEAEEALTDLHNYDLHLGGAGLMGLLKNLRIRNLQDSHVASSILQIAQRIGALRLEDAPLIASLSRNRHAPLRASARLAQQALAMDADSPHGLGECAMNLINRWLFPLKKSKVAGRVLPP